MSNKFIYTLSECPSLEWPRTEVGANGEMYSEVINSNLTIPDGFIVSSVACTNYYENNRNINETVKSQILENIKCLETKLGKTFGSSENPLFLSVRTKSRFAVPGVMSAILYLGINESIAESVATESGNSLWIYDCYKTFIETYSVAVHGISPERFKEILENFKFTNGISSDANLSTQNIKSIIDLYKSEYRNKTGHDFPNEPSVQLFNAIKAGFDSWDNPEANEYREEYATPFATGVAITIQPMIYTTRDNECGSGTVYTRNPETGEKTISGKYYSGPNKKMFDISNTNVISDLFPTVYRQMKHIVDVVENHWHGIQKVDFAVQANTVYIIGVHNCKQTPYIAVKLACEYVEEGIMTEQQASYALSPKEIYELQKRDDLEEDFKIKFERVYGWAKANDEFGILARDLARLADAEKYKDTSVEFNAEDINF